MIQGQKICLRAWRDGDIDALQAIRNDVETQLLLMAEPRPNSRDRVRTWLQNKSLQDDGVLFVIAELSSDQAIGFVQAQAIQRNSGAAYLGICLDRASRGSGAGSESLALFERYLYGVLGLRKLQLEVLASNAGAVRFYELAGYRSVGTLQSHHRAGDAYHDVLLMEKLLSGSSTAP